MRDHALQPVRVKTPDYTLLHVLGRGGNATAYLAQNRRGELFVIKKMHSGNAGNLGNSSAEAAIAMDIGVAVDHCSISNSYCIVYRYLGVSLEEYLKNNTSLTELERIDLAIKITMILIELNEGFASKTGTPYSHLDIKPENITVKEGEIYFIDLGFAQSLNSSMTTMKGTPRYFLRTDDKYFAYIPTQQFDMFALLRTLYSPMECVVLKTKNINNVYDWGLATRNSPPILTDEMIDKLPLLKEIFVSEKYADSIANKANKSNEPVKITPIEILCKLVMVRQVLMRENTPTENSNNLLSKAHTIKVCAYLAVKSIRTTVRQYHFLKEKESKKSKDTRENHKKKLMQLADKLLEPAITLNELHAILESLGPIFDEISHKFTAGSYDFLTTAKELATSALKEPLLSSFWKSPTTQSPSYLQGGTALREGFRPLNNTSL